MRQLLKCDNCGRIFYRDQRVNQLSYKHTFCSKKCEAEYRNTQVSVRCAYCGKVFKTSLYKKKNGRKYCSVECMGKAYRKTIVLRCSICGRIFKTIPARVNRSKNIFCSRKCADIAKTYTGKVKTYQELPYEWGYLLGVMCSDGYLVNYNDKRYKNSISKGLGLFCKEIGFAKKFSEVIEKITGIKYPIKKRKNKKAEMNLIDIRHRNLWETVNGLGTFDCGNWRVPDIVKYGNEKIKIGFLQGFFDGDGCISQGRQGRLFPILSFSSSNFDGLTDIGKLLTYFKIDFTISCENLKAKNKNWKDHYTLNILRKGDVITYSELIGFGKPEHKNKFEKCCQNYLKNVKYQNTELQKGRKIEYGKG